MLNAPVKSKSKPTFLIISYFFPLAQQTSPSFPSMLKSTRPHRQYNHQRRHNQRARHPSNQHDTPPTRGELTPYNIMLSLKVAMKADEKDEDGDSDEGSAEGLSDVAEPRFWGRGAGRGLGLDGGV